MPNELVVTDRMYPGVLHAARMARTRYQRGTVVRSGKAIRYWRGRYWEDVRLESGNVVRKLKSVRLGTCDELRTERDARRALQPYLDIVNSTSFRPTTEITFASFVTQYVERMLPKERKASYRVDISSILNHHLVPQLGRIELARIDTLMVQKVVDRISPGRAKNVLMTLRKLWSVAHDWGYVKHGLGKVKLTPYVRTERRNFTEAEAWRIIENATEPYQTMYWVAAESGIRGGELLALRYKDIDLSTQNLDVNQSVWNGKFGDPKTRRGMRKIRLSNDLIYRIATLAAGRKPEDLIFITSRGTPWRQNNILNRHLHPLLDELKIPRGSFHAFRHLNSTKMDAEHVPMALRLQRLGHSDTSTTFGYTHVVTSDEVELSRKMGLAFAPSNARGLAKTVGGVN